MDKKTIERYQSSAPEFIHNYKSVKPRRVYELIATFFKTNSLTLDIGCASGRDLAYLSGSGFIVEGMDPVPAFVEHCRRNLTNVPIYNDALPHLETIQQEGKYANVLLSAVLMHIPKEQLPLSVKNILRITAEGGRIFISVRKPRPESIADIDREDDLRLYNPIDPNELIGLFKQFGGKLLFHEEQTESVRSGIVWYNFVFEKLDNKVQFINLNTLLVFTNDVQKSVSYYQKCLKLDPVELEENFGSFRIGDTFLNFHPADDKSPVSSGGSVGYFLVKNIHSAIRPFLENGARVYRGPLKINDHLSIVQVIDPFGNVIGFEGSEY